jgi:MFS transporter, DHA2 family, multidrug resistance protein
VTRREQFHQSRIVEHLQPLDPAYSTFATQLQHAIGAASSSAQEVVARTVQLAQQQVMVLSYLDAFKLFGVLFLLLLPLLLFVRPGAARSGGGGA